MSLSLLWFIFFIVFLITGVPIVACIGTASFFTLIILQPHKLLLVASLMFEGINSYLLLAIPLFMTVGLLMNKGGTAEKIFGFANSLVGWTPGGLGAVNVTASMLFGGISGSSAADAAGLAPIEMRAMVSQDYPVDYSAAISVASSTLAVVIPPSVLLVVYGVVAETSLSKVLVAGYIPGITIGLGMILYNFYVCRKHGLGRSERLHLRQILLTGRQAFLSLLAPIVIMGGILGGFFTPTEAGGVGVFYVLLITVLVERTISLKALKALLIESARTAGSVVLIVASSTITTYILVSENVPVAVMNFLLGISDNPVVILLFINGILLISGMLMPPTPSLIMLVPILLPVIKQIGVDPVHFGIIACANLAIGVITPPVGPCLFILCAATRLSLGRLCRAVIPFIIVLLAILMLITFVPALSMFLPNLLF
ncbi:TRAP transporter large permease subunit [candidate division KSB3 bacterium]|uniref:TRAP transporter large permease subunit n=1 Tax=candidate division KSB3 bacterium TaxID=2044937 RepID=A0A9D5Q7P9_9BACT|nr:TRAP transporter large permease subunit [candidate division KSB3 bacterium]MBD3326532.1 TRAP transporter large permease subunit [candidate division KSB3 bacterium]